MDLNKLTTERKDLGEVNNYEGKSTQLLSGSQESVQTFFPLAVDDYFMSVAIMSQWLSNTDQVCFLVFLNVLAVNNIALSPE